METGSAAMTEFQKSQVLFPLWSQACSDSRGGNIDPPLNGLMINVTLPGEHAE